MRELLFRCLIAQAATLALSAAVLLLYPADSGFTITTPSRTSYLPGGVFLGTVLLCFLDLAIAAYAAWRLSRSL